MVTSYLGGEQPEAFYYDSRRSWMRTGDRALMSEEGAIFIVNRIKDIIKKTGISLSPAVIEFVLNSIDGVEVSPRSILPSTETPRGFCEGPRQRLTYPFLLVGICLWDTRS